MPERDLTAMRLSRFIFVMKALAEDDLWDELAVRLEDHGHSAIMINLKQIAVMQQVLQEKIAAGEAVGKRSRMFAFCSPLDCQVRPPNFPPSSGGGGRPGGPLNATPPPPPDTPPDAGPPDGGPPDGGPTDGGPSDGPSDPGGAP